MTKIKLFDSFEIDTDSIPREIIKTIPDSYVINSNLQKTISIREKQKSLNIDYHYVLFFDKNEIESKLEEVIKFNTNLKAWYEETRPSLEMIWNRRTKSQ